MLALSIMLELPTIAGGPAALAGLRPAGDVLALLSAVALSRAAHRRRLVHGAVIAMAVILAAYRIDVGLYTAALRSEPLLYDQVSMIRHLGVFVVDVMSWALLAIVVGVVVAVGAVLVLVRWILREMAHSLEPAAIGRTMRGGLVAWALVVLATAAPAMGTVSAPLVHWVGFELAGNLAESWATHTRVGRGLARSPYAAYDSIALVRRPDVELMLIESYGRLLDRHGDVREEWRALLRDFEGRLAAGGWSMASGFSRSTVSGGRSWLADAAIILGTEIRYEAVFRNVLDRGENLPSLVHFFHRQGYETVLVAPADRARPGVDVANNYGYDQVLHHLALDYRGPPTGWGLVPDQYSLGFVRAHLADSPSPIFVNFHAVSSHAPWREIPAMLADWRAWNDRPGAEAAREERPGAVELELRAKRYRRELVPTTHYMGQLDALKLDAYRRAIRYDLEVFFEDLVGQERDALVVVMGDHQPPFLAVENTDFDVPVHVLARDRALLQEFLVLGFRPGLEPPADGPAGTRHEALFSLLVRTLVRCCSGGSELPPYLAEGYELLPPDDLSPAG